MENLIRDSVNEKKRVKTKRERNYNITLMEKTSIEWTLKDYRQYQRVNVIDQLDAGKRRVVTESDTMEDRSMDRGYVGIATPAPVGSSQVVATQSGCLSCQVPVVESRRGCRFFEVHDRLTGTEIDPQPLPVTVCCDVRGGHTRSRWKQ